MALRVEYEYARKQGFSVNESLEFVAFCDGYVAGSRGIWRRKRAVEQLFEMYVDSSK